MAAKNHRFVDDITKAIKLNKRNRESGFAVGLGSNTGHHVVHDDCKTQETSNDAQNDVVKT